MIQNLYKINLWFRTQIGFFLLFCVVFSTLTIFIGLYDDFNAPPSGIHLWRQTDGISQVINYEENGLRFFDHGITFNQLDNGGKAVGEFPLPYYLAATINIVFGHQLWHIRLVWLVFLAAGIYSLSKLIFMYLKEPILAVLIAHTFFLSHVFNAYALNFLPDPIAINSLFIGCLFWYKHYVYEKKYMLILAIVFVSLAGMIKPFYLIPAIAVLVLLALKYLSKQVKLKTAIIYVRPILFGLLLTIAWFLWVKYYNNVLYPNDFFLNELMPVWSESEAAVKNIISAVKTLWLNEYLTVNLFGFLAILLTTILMLGIFINKKHKTYLSGRTLVLVSFLGGLIYTLLMFRQFMHHDYYILPILFLIPLCITILLHLLLNKNKTLSTVLFVIVFGVLFYKHYTTPSIRYKSWLSESYKAESYHMLLKQMKQLNISQDKKILVLTEEAPQTAHYFLDMKGWSKFNIRREGIEAVKTYPFDYILTSSVEGKVAFKFENNMEKLILSNSGFKLYKAKKVEE